MAILANNLAHPIFVCFMVFDILAMLSSVVAIVALIWAQMGDAELVYKAFQLALPSLSLALTTMSIAFLYGVLVTTSCNFLLLFFINIIQIPFYFLLIFDLTPYVGPDIKRSFGSTISISLWVLLRFVNEDDSETYHNSGSGQTRGV
uniref:PGG domain-containing protein n=1 Tax=Noccaea caerulescens TaxID=107243 RepID=A0A1J3G2C2_NOCCA